MLGRVIADGGLDVVGDPLNEVGGVLVLNVENLLLNHFIASDEYLVHKVGEYKIVDICRLSDSPHIGHKLKRLMSVK